MKKKNKILLATWPRMDGTISVYQGQKLEEVANFDTQDQANEYIDRRIGAL